MLNDRRSVARVFLGLTVLLGIAPLLAEAPQVRDLGNGIHAAIGAAMGTAVQIPQSNTFMIATRDGNM